MKKKIVYVLLGCIASAFMGYRGYDAYNAKKSSSMENGLILENIEALAQTEIMQKCSRPVKYGSCYDEDNMWKGSFIDEVEYYEVPVGSPIVCHHFSTQSCPPGTHKGDVEEA